MINQTDLEVVEPLNNFVVVVVEEEEEEVNNFAAKEVEGL